MLLRAYSDKQTAQVMVLVCVMRWLIDWEESLAVALFFGSKSLPHLG